MLVILSQMLLLLSLATILGIIIGYWLGTSSCSMEEGGSRYVNKDISCPIEPLNKEKKEVKVSEKEDEFDDKGSDTKMELNTIAEEGVDNSITNAQTLFSDNSENKTEISDDKENDSNDGNNDRQEAKAETVKEKNETDFSVATKKEVSDPSKDNEDNENLLSENVGKTVEDEKLDEPKFLSIPNGEKDNLKRIKGIGVKLEEKLNKLGIFHFSQISAWTEKEIAWVDKHLAFSGRIKRENWVEQAKKLAIGEETEFSKRVDAGEVSTSKKA